MSAVPETFAPRVDVLERPRPSVESQGSVAAEQFHAYCGSEESTVDTESACGQDEQDVPYSFGGELQRLRTNDPFADEYPSAPDVLERIITNDEFENKNATMLNAPLFQNFPMWQQPFTLTMVAPQAFNPDHGGVSYLNQPSVQSANEVPHLFMNKNEMPSQFLNKNEVPSQFESTFPLGRVRTYDPYDESESNDVHRPYGLPLVSIRNQYARFSEDSSPSIDSDTPLHSPRLGRPITPTAEWEAKDATEHLQAAKLCGGGPCRPCYDHIRGKCQNDACGYCHADVHGFRRKQKKHQRKVQMHIERSALDAHPQVACTAMLPKATGYANHHQGDAHRSGACQPCFKHIRGACTLGASCAYCHDEIHTVRHKQKKQVRSSQRTSNRYVAINGLGGEI